MVSDAVEQVCRSPVSLRCQRRHRQSPSLLTHTQGFQKRLVIFAGAPPTVWISQTDAWSTGSEEVLTSGDDVEVSVPAELMRPLDDKAGGSVVRGLAWNTVCLPHGPRTISSWWEDLRMEECGPSLSPGRSCLLGDAQ